MTVRMRVRRRVSVKIRISVSARIWARLRMRVMAVAQALFELRSLERTFLIQNSPFVQHMVLDGDTSHSVVPDKYDVTACDA